MDYSKLDQRNVALVSTELGRKTYLSGLEQHRKRMIFLKNFSLVMILVAFLLRIVFGVVFRKWVLWVVPLMGFGLTISIWSLIHVSYEIRFVKLFDRLKLSSDLNDAEEELIRKFANNISERKKQELPGLIIVVVILLIMSVLSFI